MGPEDATVHAQPEGMPDELMAKLRSALRFAASRSVMSSADEQAILAALAQPVEAGEDGLREALRAARNDAFLAGYEAGERGDGLDYSLDKFDVEDGA